MKAKLPLLPLIAVATFAMAADLNRCFVLGLHGASFAQFTVRQFEVTSPPLSGERGADSGRVLPSTDKGRGLLEPRVPVPLASEAAKRHYC